MICKGCLGDVAILRFIYSWIWKLSEQIPNVVSSSFITVTCSDMWSSDERHGSCLTWFPLTNSAETISTTCVFSVCYDKPSGHETSFHISVCSVTVKIICSPLRTRPLHGDFCKPVRDGRQIQENLIWSYLLVWLLVQTASSQMTTWTLHWHARWTELWSTVTKGC